MIGNNSCGVHSVMGDRTSDNIHELEILTYEGLRYCQVVGKANLKAPLQTDFAG